MCRFFCGSLHGECWALTLQRSAMNRFVLDIPLAHNALQPLTVALEVVLRWCSPTCDVYKLSMTLADDTDDEALVFSVATAECVALRPGAKRSKKEDNYVDAESCSEEDVDAVLGGAGSDSDAPSVVSDREADAEHEIEEASALDLCGEAEQAQEEEDASDTFVRFPAGTWVVQGESDGYFTMTNDLHFPYCKVCIKKRWAMLPPEGMGEHGSPQMVESGQLKAANVLKYDIDRQDQQITFIVLHTWKLWRARHIRLCRLP